ncbi:MAG: hypothetical protein RLZZ440_1610 [Planctomycetota bacterium]|jgi:hypothetical protein
MAQRSPLRLAAAIALAAAGSLAAARADVRVVGDPEAGFQLLRNGKPFVIRGVGGTANLATLAACGGNAIRTWDAASAERIENGRSLLDEADAHGIAVMVGLWLGHERHGFDYSDPADLAKQRADVEAAVSRLKDHPGVLAWGLGNEMEGPGGSGDSPAIWREVEELARRIKTIDPDHPVMTVVANVNPAKLAAIRTLAPSIDVLGVNAYADAARVGDKLREADWQKPYCITEFGLAGPWESPHTPWNAPIEPTTREKAAQTFVACRRIMEDQRHCLGTFAFLWGSKQEATASWFGILLPTGEKTPRADALCRAWTGHWPENRAPILDTVEMPMAGKRVAPGTKFELEARYRDPEGGPLDYRWDVREESSDRRVGGDAERPPALVPGVVLPAANAGQATLTAPERPGSYRLFVTVLDGDGSGCMDNWTFHVDPQH